MQLSEAIERFFEAKRAEQYSEHTLRDYDTTFKRFQKFMRPAPEFEFITSRDIRKFLLSLRGVKKKTILNYWIGLSSLWTWAVAEEICEEQVVRKIRPPKPEKTAVRPLSMLEVKALLENLGRHPLRNRAIIFTLLDTGVRSSELCDLQIRDIEGKYLRVRHGKGDKERRVPYSHRCGESILLYMRHDRHPRTMRDQDPLFVTTTEKKMRRDGLLKLLQRIGERAGVPKVHPHRFRHTFAIEFLRNGGDIYSLQAIMGHSTLEMVRRYLALSELDLEAAHKRASPVGNWGL